ncbi:MAG: YafY family transcriptional regulator [Pseudomonadales bacterium]|nr:YafY family transcriptional regulator [Pseudomonadales bacterium]
MRKAERLFQIMTLLRSRRSVITAAELAENLQVSERTIYRDMQALSLSGMPIESETGIGYRLMSGFSIAPLMFTEEELEALILGVRMVQGWSGPKLGQAADSALHKIKAVLPESLHKSYVQQPEWLIVPDFYRDQSSPYSDEIREAIKSRSQIMLLYTDEKKRQTSRQIWPLGLVFWGRTWTLVAWCTLREDYRLFRLDRINNLILMQEKFSCTAKINLQHYLALQAKINPV